MSFIEWLTLATVCTLGAISPGPSLALIISNTVKGGVKNGIITSIGHGIGVGLYALLTILGLSIIIKNTPWLFDILQISGAFFLIYMAGKILRAKPSEETEESTEHKGFKGFSGGFLVAFLNPKLAIFFIALFSQFLEPNYHFVAHSIMVATAGGIDILWYCIVTLLVGKTRLNDILVRHSRKVDIASAIVFILIAATVLVSFQNTIS